MDVINLCLSDIPKERIYTAANGKKYLNIVVTKLRQTDNYGNNLTCYISQNKEQRDAKQEKIYIGKGKSHEQQQTPHYPNKQQQNTPPVQNNNDTEHLPF